MNDKLQEAQELENKARELRFQAMEEKRKAERKAEEEFKGKHKMDVYTSDDYCGMESGRYEFYYGYEETWCPKHKAECPDDYECDLSEWAFTAKVDGIEEMRLPKSKLHPVKGEVPFWYLIAGIGHFLMLEQHSKE